uniref:hypothetical protein n=1 Tax=Gemmiger formicilis TaxID=745368 RepID=UPI003FEF9E6A
MDEFLPYSPTKQKEPLTWVEVSGKTKALHKAAIIMKKALRFRKAFFGAPSGTRTQDPLIKSQLLSLVAHTHGVC